MSQRTLAGAVADDVVIGNTLAGYPSSARSVGGGIHVAGTTTGYAIVSGSLTVKCDDDITPGLADSAKVALCDPTKLAAFLTRYTAAPLVFLCAFLVGCSGATSPVSVWMVRGQSNAVGHGPYQGTWPGVDDVSYLVNGTPTYFGPNPVDLGAPLGGTNTHGCELGIGQAARTAHPEQKVAICKAAVDSLTIDQLMTGAPWTNALAGIAKIKPLATTYNYFWIQGEADTVDPTGYATKLTNMFTTVEAAFGGPVNFFVLLLNIKNAQIDAPSCTAIRAAQVAAVSTWVALGKFAVIVNADDLVPVLGSVGNHYDSAQLIEIGRRGVAAAP